MTNACAVRRGFRAIGWSGLLVLTLVFVAASVLAACTPGPSATSAPPSAPASAPASVGASPSSSSAEPSPAISPSAAPSQDTSPSAAPTASVGEACPVVPQTGQLPSDRLVAVRLSGAPTVDLITFEFGNMSVPEPPQGTSKGSLGPADRPLIHGTTGQQMEVDGDNVAGILFTGMSLMNDVGEPTYDGPLDLRLDGAVALRDVRNFDMSEGVIGWYIGYDGNGCVRLTSDAHSVTLAVDHPRR